jgi:tRNA C32,U32 (ribose-2'-O)-methylase TrmJ
MFASRKNLFEGKNDIEFFDKVDKLLVAYHKRSDARTKEMMYDILKLIRIIDNRDYCNDEDMKILQYMIESIDNKVEVVDTAKFKVNGPHNIIEEIKEQITPEQSFDYNSDLGEFDER